MNLVQEKIDLKADDTDSSEVESVEELNKKKVSYFKSYLQLKIYFNYLNIFSLNLWLV